MNKEIYKLYKGKITLEYNDTQHRYSINDKTVYGVSSIVQVISKPALLYWGVNVAADFFANNLEAGKSYDELEIKKLVEQARSAHRIKKEDAADLGGLIHEWLDKFFKAIIDKTAIPKPPINKEMKNALNGFKKWISENKIKPIASEQKIYSIKENYAGTFDLLAKVNNKLTIIDFKTGNALYSDYLLQCAAYLKAKEEEEGKIFDGGVTLIRLSKENKEKEIKPFEIKQVDRKNIDELFNVFLGAKRIYEWQMKLKGEQIKNNH